MSCLLFLESMSIQCYKNKARLSSRRIPQNNKKFGTQCWKMHVIMWNQIAWEAVVQDLLSKTLLLPWITSYTLIDSFNQWNLRWYPS